MPCSQRKARVLLKEGKAIINTYNPFTIQLTYATGETKQDCHIGVDTGAKHIGIAVTSEDKDRTLVLILILSVFIVEVVEAVNADIVSRVFLIANVQINGCHQVYRTESTILLRG